MEWPSTGLSGGGCDGEVVIAESSMAFYAVPSVGCTVPKPKGDENSQWRA